VTVTLDALLENGSDLRFRSLVGNLVTFAAEILRIRETIASRLGISAPQFNILTAIAQLQDEAPNVSRIARRLKVSVPFVVTETGTLLSLGLIEKTPDPDDRRRVQLRLSHRGRRALEAVAPFQRRVNDMLFRDLSRGDFEHLEGVMETLVTCAETTITMLDEHAADDLRSA
jgi:DNA-binding MarR family transcriptional regulator